MEKIATEEETREAKKLLDFYVDLVQNNNPNMGYHLDENVILDWFGRTVKERKKVCQFMKEQGARIRHQINNTFPSDNVAFRDTHKVKISTQPEIDLKPVRTDEFSTPPKQTGNHHQPSTSSPEIGQGDGLHNVLMSPKKKIKLSHPEEEETVEEESQEPKSRTMKYLTAEGDLEFRRPSIKKFQNETKWKRPMKLHIGYTYDRYKYCTIYLIVYEGNLKCRRNLLREFDSETKQED